MKKASKKAEDVEDAEDEEDAESEEEMEVIESEEEEEGNESESDEEDETAMKSVVNTNKALAVVLDEMVAAKRGMPWAESFDVIPSDPLPFGGDAAEGSPLDVHDDLKREVAFYNIALEAVKEARNKCNEANIPFSRPEDFFAEMVKTDGKDANVFTTFPPISYVLFDSRTAFPSQIIWQRLRTD